VTTPRPIDRRHFLAAAALPIAASTWAATAPMAMNPTTRRIELDLDQAGTPLDRFFDHCVGADYPGTLYRDDSMAQLKTATEELGFRYLRFHAFTPSSTTC
jgi:xylan 1,4-beta-xylosidase